jgi:WhiB family redox-sensing transcriptional regulator
MGTTIDFNWQDNAACKNMSSEKYDAFYPSKGRSSEKDTNGICNGCPVREECLEHALKYEEYGYWAGTTSRQRVNIRKELGIELVDIDYENFMKYAGERARIEEAVQAHKMKRGPKGPRKAKEEEEEWDELDLLFRY